MRPIRFIPDNTKYDFVRRRLLAFAFSGLLLAATLVSLVTQGLNLGIDFEGGILLEIAAPETVDMGELRGSLGDLGLGDVELQQFGDDRTILIRVQRQEGDDRQQQRAAEAIKAELGDRYEYLRIEYVGPTVGAELLRDGILATVLALLAIAAYVAFRFEWQFGVASLIATFHDVATTVGLFSILQLEFDLTAIAALLTIAGYSINDTVVIFDRIRETLRRRKSADLAAIINESVNRTLSRTFLTSGTTLLAVLPLLLLGGATLYNFSLAMVWGIVIGTFSSVFVAAALLLYMPPVGRTAPETTAAAPPAAGQSDRKGAS